MNNRPGFSLAELLVSIVVLTVVGGAMHDSLRRQQQVFRSIALMIAARGDVRDATEVLAADLGATSPLDTLSLAADSAIESYSLIGASVACDSAPGGTIRLPPDLRSGHRLTTLLSAPDSGDVLLVFSDDSGAGVGRWERHAIAGVSSQAAMSACPASTGFTAAADGAASSLVISLRTAASGDVRAGAPVRILRRGRYSLYRSSDSRWYLGNRRCNSSGPPACALIQPMSGPYAAYSPGPGSSGLALRYYDARGHPLESPLGSEYLARIEVTVRSRSRMASYRGTSQAAPFVDSAALSIALRNRD